MIEFIKQPWTWYVSGTMIAATMFILIYFGKSFGFSSNLRTICTVMGGGKAVEFFNFKWKDQIWNLVFLLGAIIGGYIAAQYLSDGQPVLISESTISDLNQLGFSAPTSVQPDELYSFDAMMTVKGFLILSIGGLMVGFGSRWAGGCTSGHAISGLSDLQIPSLIAVIGFFAGGLIMTHLFMPLIF